MSKRNGGLFGGICVVAGVVIGSAALVMQPSAQAESAAVGGGAADGKQVYERICQGCHMPDAKGAVGAGKYPALAGDPALASRQFMALTVLNGRRNMPAFGSKHAVGFGGPGATLSSAEIAAVINYVRTNFGNRFTDAISPEEVGALDQSTK
jgi:mono/diheme cytochrome c family protein